MQEVCPLTLPEDIPLAELVAISDDDSGVLFSTHDMFILTDIDCGQICLCYECHHGDDKSKYWIIQKNFEGHKFVKELL